MNIRFNLTLNERAAIHSSTLSLSELDRGNFEYQCNNELKKFRLKLTTIGRSLTLQEKRNFMTDIEFSTICYAINADKEGFSGCKFRKKTRNALIAHYTSPIFSGSSLPTIPQLLH